MATEIQEAAQKGRERYARGRYAWRRRTGKSLEDKGKVPKPKAAKSKPAYKKTLEEQEKRRGALGRLVSKKRKK
jgi:hypothetical protein